MIHIKIIKMNHNVIRSSLHRYTKIHSKPSITLSQNQHVTLEKLLRRGKKSNFQALALLLVSIHQPELTEKQEHRIRPEKNSSTN
jgi:hypothetical protein